MTSKYMRKALSLAEKGDASPNPKVGCVIVKDGEIIAQGFHRKAGLPHAEIEALKKITKNQAKDSTIYVTLEPCCFYGRTPPCADALIAAGVKKVVAAMKDPNPKVSGKGLKKLRDAGIEVEVGVLEEEAKALNESYIHFQKTGTPFVIVKAAMTADGKIASKTGDSKWISGEKSREQVHKLRSQVDAIMVGIGTILADDPKLTSRVKGGRDPLRVIIDPELEIPLKAKVLADENALIITSKQASKEKIGDIRGGGVQVLVRGGKSGKINFKNLKTELGEKGVTSLLIEGGGEVIGSAFDAKIVDKFILYVAPKIIGGRDAKTLVAGDGIEKITDAVKLKDMIVENVGVDFRLTGYPSYRNRAGFKGFKRHY
ncbi:MAG: bifunctional diaminohydroxyphosphoribosylaminopyrimidine deaminase/5-amino-6-(5-phosphoribosylamino)uracil reductase RibD [Methanobacteriota archaeon]